MQGKALRELKMYFQLYMGARCKLRDRIYSVKCKPGLTHFFRIPFGDFCVNPVFAQTHCVTYKGVAPGVGPLLGRLELLQSLELPLLRLVRARRAHVGDLEGLKVL